MGTLSHLKPEHVWRHFERICSIPHPSRHEEGIVAYIEEEAKKHGYQTRRDDVGNLIVDVPATPGHESAPIIVLQGHMDMVPVAAPGVEHDFEKDPIKPYIDGDFVKAQGTTLGADNGIGVALALGIMEDENAVHGPLELLFTVNEESGMDGAHGIKSDFVKGRKLINLDTEEWGEFYISCAGGGDSNISLPVERTDQPSDDVQVSLDVGGLKGGHSGVDINAGRGSGNKIIARCLAAAWDAVPFNLSELEGGNKRNSIADGARAVVTVKASRLAEFNAAVSDMAKIIVDELEKTDPDVMITTEKLDENKPKRQVVTASDTKKIIDLLIALPHGVLAMSPDVPGLVETSTNLGVMALKDKTFTATLLTRSAVTSRLNEVKQRIKTIAGFAGASVDEPRGYPGWKPNMDSELLKTAVKVFKDRYGEEPAIKAIHAGLECGLFSEKLPGVDMLSLGPEMHNVHSPAEELNIPSVPKTYELLVAILEALA